VREKTVQAVFCIVKTSKICYNGEIDMSVTAFVERTTFTSINVQFDPFRNVMTPLENETFR